MITERPVVQQRGMQQKWSLIISNSSCFDFSLIFRSQMQNLQTCIEEQSNNLTLLF